MFILDDRIRPMGGASRWWLHGSLRELNGALRHVGSRLILRRGTAREVIMELAQDTDASAVLWNRLYDPAIVKRDSKIEAQLAVAGIATKTFNASLLFEPWTASTEAGTPFKVFTAFWRRCSARDMESPGSTPPVPAAPTTWPGSEGLHRWEMGTSNLRADFDRMPWRNEPDELRRLSDKDIHAPWQASEDVLARANARLGQTYPYPLVDLDHGRKRALEAWRTRVRGAARPVVR